MKRLFSDLHKNNFIHILIKEDRFKNYYKTKKKQPYNKKYKVKLIEEPISNNTNTHVFLTFKCEQISTYYSSQITIAVPKDVNKTITNNANFKGIINC